MNPKVDFYFTKNKQWQPEIETLRTIVLDCNLTEELKWGCPCYTFQNSNLVLIHVFKEYCAILFFKGALLRNADGLLIQQTENVQAARQIRFTNLDEKIDDLKADVNGIRDEIKESSEKATILIKDFQADNITSHKEMSTKISELEKWRWMLIGAGLVIGSLGSFVIGIIFS